MRRERGGEGLLALHNNTGASETAEGRENAAEGRSRTSVADSGREGKRRILTPFLLALGLSSYRLCVCFAVAASRFPAAFIPPSHIPTRNSLSVRPPLPHLWLPDCWLLLPPCLLLLSHPPTPVSLLPVFTCILPAPSALHQ